MLTQSIDVDGAIATIESHVHETKQVAPESIRDSNREQIAHARQRIGCLLSDVRITYSSSSSSLPSSGSSTSSSGSSASCLRLRVDIVMCGKRRGCTERRERKWKERRVEKGKGWKERAYEGAQVEELSERERGFLGRTGAQTRPGRITAPAAGCCCSLQCKGTAKGWGTGPCTAGRRSLDPSIMSLPSAGSLFPLLRCT